MAPARIRQIVGRSHRACPLCGDVSDHLVLESRNRQRLPALFAGDAELRRYLLCHACGARSELAGVVDLRDS